MAASWDLGHGRRFDLSAPGGAEVRRGPVRSRPGVQNEAGVITAPMRAPQGDEADAQGLRTRARTSTEVDLPALDEPRVR